MAILAMYTKYTFKLKAIQQHTEEEFFVQLNEVLWIAAQLDMSWLGLDGTYVVMLNIMLLQYYKGTSIVYIYYINYKHTCDTRFQSITNNIYDFGRPFLSLFFITQLRYIDRSKMGLTIKMTG